MKLLIILSIVAYGYTDKLDRTYLPPPNAGSAGGSPGALAAPGVRIGSFGQGLPSSSAPKFGANSATNFAQGGANGAQNRPGFGPSGLSQPSGPGSVSQGPSSIYQAGPIGFGTNSLSFGQNKPSLGSSGYGQPSNSFGSSNTGNQGTGFSSATGASVPSFGPVSGPATSGGLGTPQAGLNQPSGQAGSSPFNQGFGSGRPTVYEAPRPERPQAAAEKSAEILKFVNENDGESYNFSYETSNGISAEEAGVATNGVLAQGGFAYTGDDGYKYSVTYTADENGFQPQGEHLPTPPPIPEEILKSIEENARAAAAGTQEGAYRPEEYESDGSPQQNNLGASPYNQPQSQNQGYPQLQGSNLIPGSQFSTNQGNSRQSRPNASLGQFGQIKPGQFQPGFGNQNQGASGQLAGQGSIGENYNQNSQGQTNGRGQGNGYQYNQPQNAVSTTSIIGQNRPQSNSQGSINYSAGSAQNFGPIKQGSSVFGQRPSGTFEGTPNQLGSTTSAQRPSGLFGSSGTSGSSGPSPSYGPTGPAGSVGSNGFTVNTGGSSNGPFKTSGTTSQPSGVPGTVGSTGSYTPFNQGQLPSPGSKIPSLGANQPSFGSQSSLQGLQSRPGQTNRPFGSTNPSQEGYQYGLNANQPAFNTGTGISLGSFGPAAAGSSRPSGSQPSQQPSFGTQGPQSIGQPGQQYGPAAARSSGPIGSQPSQQPGFGSQGPQSIGRPGQQYGPAAAGSSGPIGSQPSQQPSFGSQAQQSIGRLGSQYGPAAVGSSGPIRSQPSQQPSSGSQGPQSIDRPGQQYGPTAAGSSGPTGSQPSQQPSFGSQAPQSIGRPGSQYGPAAVGSSGLIGSQPSQQPSSGSQGPQSVSRPGQQYGSTAAGSSGTSGSQPNQQPSFGSQGSQFNGRPSQGVSGSEFGGPRQPPSFSSQEGYKY